MHFLIYDSSVFQIKFDLRGYFELAELQYRGFNEEGSLINSKLKILDPHQN